jgi:hypothetical protein
LLHLIGLWLHNMIRMTQARGEKLDYEKKLPS